MALTRFSGDADVISQLDNQPNDNDGLSAQQLKGKFDQYGSTFKDYFNNVFIPEVESAINAAAAGIGQAGFSGAILLDHSVASEKLMNTSGAEAVATTNIRAGAVTLEKLASAIQTLLGTIPGKTTHATATVTLESGQTTWTKTVNGVTSSNVVIATAGTDDTSHAAWSNCDIRATAQGTNSLTFKARSAPASAVTVNILILN